MSRQALKGSRRLRLPDFKTGLEGFQEVEASRFQDNEGGKIVSPTHWPTLPPREIFLVLISVWGTR
jgi:hypothetical protein